MNVRPLTYAEAKAFIRAHHRHGTRPPAAGVLRVGLEHDGELIGAATAGMPARPLMDGRTLEVARVCTLGHDNACSMLYGALARAAKALGYTRLYTYTLASEPGTSLRASGWQRDGDVEARERAGKVGTRPRYATNLFGEEVAHTEARVRWRRDL